MLDSEVWKMLLLYTPIGRDKMHGYLYIYKAVCGFDSIQNGWEDMVILYRVSWRWHI